MGSSNRLRKRTALRRKLHILQALNTSKSHVKSSSSVFMDAFLYIYLLKLKLEVVKREYSNLLAIKNEYLSQMKHFHVPKKEVKVEKNEDGVINVKVRCEKEEDTLVSVLETFEEMGLHVLQARVSCTNNSFSMEATVIAQNQALDVRDLTQAITKATEKREVKMA